MKDYYSALMGEWVVAQLNVLQIEAARESIRDQLFRDDDLEMRRYRTDQRIDFRTIVPLEEKEDLLTIRENVNIGCHKEYGLLRNEQDKFNSGAYYLWQSTRPATLTQSNIIGPRGIECVRVNLPWDELPFRQRFGELEFGEVVRSWDGSLSAGSYQVERMEGKIPAAEIKARMEKANLGDMNHWLFSNELIFVVLDGRSQLIYESSSSGMNGATEWFGPSEICIDMLDSFV